MGKRRAFSNEEIEQMKILHNDGESFSSIGKKLNRDTRTIHRKLIAVGEVKVENVQKTFNEEEIEIMKNLYNKGFTYSEIGKKMNRSSGSVRDRLKTLGFKENGKFRKLANKTYLWDIEYLKPYINEEKAKHITIGSAKKILVKCTCGLEKEMKANDLVKYGVTCPTCSSHTSYPELFFLAVNDHFNLMFEYQVTIDRFRFDFINKNEKIIVEMNGRTHYEDCAWEGSHETSRESDNKKREWAKENDYILIFIDARKSEFEFIKNNINKCELLPNIKESDHCEILKLIQKNKKYPISDIVKEYNEGKSTRELADRYSISATTIRRILHKQDVKVRDCRRRIKCVETGIIYDSITDAVKSIGLKSQTGIINACDSNKPTRRTSGGYHWEYVE